MKHSRQGLVSAGPGGQASRTVASLSRTQRRSPRGHSICFSFCEMTAESSRETVASITVMSGKALRGQDKTPRTTSQGGSVLCGVTPLPQIHTRRSRARGLPPTVRHAQSEGAKVTVSSSCSSRPFKVGAELERNPSGGSFASVTWDTLVSTCALTNHSICCCQEAKARSPGFPASRSDNQAGETSQRSKGITASLCFHTKPH